MSAKLDRRDFLKVLATASAATLCACSAPKSERLIPYLVPPEEIVPGVSTWYKSVCRECPAGCGVTVRTREGRALKVEGNPDHPVNRGRLCIRGQASVQGLYNPDRIAQPLRRNADGKLEAISWQEAEELLANLLRYLRFEKQADRVALLSHRVSGSLEQFFREWMAALGSPRFQMYEPFAHEALRAANRVTFGTSEVPHFDFAHAQVVLSFGADFLETWLSNVTYALDFAQARKLRDGRTARFIHVEPRQSLTAAQADDWIAIKPETEVFLVLGLIREILAKPATGSSQETAHVRALVAPYDPQTVSGLTGISAEQIRELAQMFAKARPGLAVGGGVAVSGTHATATLVAINLLNYVCGNIGKTVQFGRGADLDQLASYQQMLDLAEAMRRDEILLLLLHHVNPVHTLPVASGFREALQRVPFKVSFASFMDETTAVADLILPDHTPLERWEDYSPRAGVYGLVQPAMRPVFSSKSVGDVLLAVGKKVGDEPAAKFPQNEFLDYMKNSWQDVHRQWAPQKDFEEFWRQAVEAGGVWLEVPVRSVHLAEGLARFSFPPATAAPTNRSTFHLAVYPSLQLYDGRGANRPWLQEVPESLSKIVWDSWVEIHPETAQERGIAEGDLLELRSPAGSLQVPAHLTDGIRRDVLAIPLGQGHSTYGRYAEGRGVNPMKLVPSEVGQASDGLIWTTTVEIEKLAANRPLVKTQLVFNQDNRNIAQAIPLAELLRAKEEQGEKKEPALRMYAPHEHPEHRWGMAIDLDACTGCNACIAACYAENNVPVVGKEQVNRGRHMAWIRLERYIEPTPRGPETRFVPMLCQQCDTAPCEAVCPVYATYHNPEGLNVQVYNRCVGTRYCANNCPYKVRRFSWFEWEWPWPMQLQLNPDLSVRSKGVMEKCTFCLQRIREGKDRAKDEGRGVRDGEITPACAQTCPSEAIVFGDLKDPASRVSRLRRDRRGYRVLEELNSESAITYLKKVVRGI